MPCALFRFAGWVRMRKTGNGTGRQRRLLVGAMGAGLLGVTGTARALLATPGQTEGPFYPLERHRFADDDHDLVRIESEARDAGGEILELDGRISDAAGRVLPGALVEIWQCDANGHYLHAADRGDKDPWFQGYGRAITDAGGEYRFRTIRPVPYSGRTPHIHFKVSDAAGRELLTTQMYVAGEPGNQRDFLYRRLDPEAQRALTVSLSRVGAGYRGRFEIVVDA